MHRSQPLYRLSSSRRRLPENATRTKQTATWSPWRGPAAALTLRARWPGHALSVEGASAQTFVQVGYTIADISAKVGLGVYIYFIARGKTEAEGYDLTAGSANGDLGSGEQGIRAAA